MTWRKFGAGIVAAGVLTSGGTVAIDQAVINPYTDKGSHYELKLKPDIDQGERVEIAKDRAAMTMKGWNDEYAITITPQIPSAPTFGAAAKIDKPFTTAANRPLLSKKMEFKSGGTTAFIEPVANTNDQFDIDFTLDAKPDTNVFEYKIDGADDFDFFYQPALTQDEIDEGAERPDNVVGSYAVYSKTKANNCTNCGTPNYATGKIAHIYRPKAIDANGKEVWGELQYQSDTGMLYVFIPQDFLDKATYPVRVDPTFGYTSIGSSGIGSSAIKSTTATLVEDGSITTFTVCSSHSTSGFLGVALYSDNPGNPATKLAEDTGNVTVSGAGCTWRDLNISYSVTAGTYWLAQWTSNSTTRYYDAASSGTSYTVTGSFETWPSTMTGESAESRIYSIYATYTASGPSNSCTYSGSGNWNILGSDNCYVTGNIYVTGDCNLIGTGGLNLAGTISCNDIHAASGFSVRGKNNTALLYTRN